MHRPRSAAPFDVLKENSPIVPIAARQHWNSA
jgi:hypothetical protein